MSVGRPLPLCVFVVRYPFSLEGLHGPWVVSRYSWRPPAKRAADPAAAPVYPFPRQTEDEAHRSPHSNFAVRYPFSVKGVHGPWVVSRYSWRPSAKRAADPTVAPVYPSPTEDGKRSTPTTPHLTPPLLPTALFPVTPAPTSTYPPDPLLQPTRPRHRPTASFPSS